MKLVIHEKFDCLERADVVEVYLENENGERRFIGSEKSRNELAVFKIIAAAQYEMKGLDSNGKSKNVIV